MKATQICRPAETRSETPRKAGTINKTPYLREQVVFFVPQEFNVGKKTFIFEFRSVVGT